MVMARGAIAGFLAPLVLLNVVVTSYWDHAPVVDVYNPIIKCPPHTVLLYIPILYSSNQALSWLQIMVCQPLTRPGTPPLARVTAPAGAIATTAAATIAAHLDVVTRVRMRDAALYMYNLYY